MSLGKAPEVQASSWGKWQDTSIADYVIKAEDGAMEFFFLPFKPFNLEAYADKMKEIRCIGGNN